MNGRTTAVDDQRASYSSGFVPSNDGTHALWKRLFTFYRPPTCRVRYSSESVLPTLDRLASAAHPKPGLLGVAGSGGLDTLQGGVYCAYDKRRPRRCAPSPHLDRPSTPFPACAESPRQLLHGAGPPGARVPNGVAGNFGSDVFRLTRRLRHRQYSLFHRRARSTPTVFGRSDNAHGLEKLAPIKRDTMGVSSRQAVRREPRHPSNKFVQAILSIALGMGTRVQNPNALLAVSNGRRYFRETCISNATCNRIENIVMLRDWSNRTSREIGTNERAAPRGVELLDNRHTFWFNMPLFRCRGHYSFTHMMDEHLENSGVSSILTDTTDQSAWCKRNIQLDHLEHEARQAGVFRKVWTRVRSFVDSYAWIPSV
ncbi:hypothetical protein DFH11DRAFT_1548497 [Phellopilus nigrolimitatus]|nr:hypothetical protein DFH11DRAFT_1548497 [Phellopilus nigrolimitatus]